MSNIKVKIKKPPKEDSELESLSREQLLEKVKQLQAHVTQLKNLLKSNVGELQQSRRQKPFDHKKYARRHILLHIAYTGWDYGGYVVQEQTHKTIEAEIFKALAKTCLVDNRETSNYHRCGRTDKGVSSFGQVISLDVRSNLSCGNGVFIPNGHEVKSCLTEEKDEIRYTHILNKVLPLGIRAIAWASVSQTFSARFDCSQRLYEYYFPKANLNIDDMRSASTFLIGNHDFRNLCKMDVGNGVVQFRRTMSSITIEPIGDDKDEYSMYKICLAGQAFLWHQVRCIVAILFLVGQGKEEATVVKDLLDVETNPRKPQYTMASELPLNLHECVYRDVKWLYDEEALQFVISDFQRLWTEHSVKSTMLKAMLGKLESHSNIKVSNQLKSLTEGVEPKTYVPLLKRQKCDSLEQRIEHYTKRRRLQIMEDESQSETSHT